MQTFRIAVGHAHGVKPGNIVGAIANEAGLDSKHIGRIEIYDDYSVLDLPDNMPENLLNHLKSVWVAGQQLRITREGEQADDFNKAEGRQHTETFASKARHERNALAERPAPSKKERAARKSDVDMQTFRIEVGHVHGVKPANIVGAIANETGLDSQYIGRIEIFDDYSVLDLPESMPKEVFEQLKTVWVAGQQLGISHTGTRAPVERKSVDKKIALSVPKKGADRRVSEKKLSSKTPFKAKSGFGNRTADAAKPKPHRKGPKPA